MKKNNLVSLISYAMIAAIFCILSPISVPIGPIPISLTNFILYLAIFIVGTKGSFISFIVYLLLGTVGLPVFSGYQGGLAKLVGPTGGYLVGFIPMIFIMGFFYYRIAMKKSIVPDVVITIAGMILGTIIAYFVGTAWFVFTMECEWSYALTVCVIPFIPFDIAKMVIANIVGRPVRRTLLKQQLIQ